MRRLRRGRLAVHLPDGRAVAVEGPEPGPAAEIRLRRGRVLRRFALRGTLGFGEAYVDGDWDSPDLAALLVLLKLNEDAWGPAYRGARLARWAGLAAHALRANTRAGSRRNARAHYDLGNEFFAAWLDPHMLYSSALFGAGGEGAALGDAQLAKCRHLARLVGLGPGHRLLEIGTGWGAFATLAATEFGAHVTTITLSREQHAGAAARVMAMGLGERVEVRLQDYRDVEPGAGFDRVVAIEMLEAVGEAFWPAFFGKLAGCLGPGGRAGLQVITVADGLHANYRATPDFVRAHVFPGGMLPSPAILRRLATAAGLVEERSFAFGGDYARTLALWRRAFDAAWPSLSGRGGRDARFGRLWAYYLAYCEAGFRTGVTDVSQTVLRPAAG